MSVSRESSRSAPQQRKVRQVYKLGKTLGTGGFAVVKLGTHLQDNSEWAIKVMTVPKGSTPDEQAARDDIFKEIEILTGIKNQRSTT